MRTTEKVLASTELLEEVTIEAGAFVHAEKVPDSNGISSTERIERSIDILSVDVENRTVSFAISYYDEETDSGGEFDGEFAYWGFVVQLLELEDGATDVPEGFHSGEAYFNIPIPELGLSLVGAGFAD